MIRYITRRFLGSIPTLLVLITFVFLAMHFGGGDPARVVAGSNANSEIVQQIREDMGLNRSLTVQYFDYVGSLVRGNLGNSLITGAPITKLLGPPLLRTLELTLVVTLVSAIVGIPLGIFLSYNRGNLVDQIGRWISILFLAFPGIYFAFLLMIWFSLKLNLFPLLGSGPAGLLQFGSRITYLILPALVLSKTQIVIFARLSRSSFLNILSEDYLRTARSKGLNEFKVVLKHGLRNSLIPLITMAGINFTLLLGSSVVIENIFGRTGLGRLIVGAILQDDYPVIQSVLVVYCVIVIIVNLLVDLTYGVIDPRIQYK